MAERPPGGAGIGGVGAVAAAALAIGCCAGLPLIAALASSVAVGTLLGIGAGVLGAVVLVGGVVLVVRARRRRACEPKAARGAPAAPRRH